MRRLLHKYIISKNLPSNIDTVPEIILDGILMEWQCIETEDDRTDGMYFYLL